MWYFAFSAGILTGRRNLSYFDLLSFNGDQHEVSPQ